MAFAENLQYIRRKNKITQEQLAEELNVSRQSVSKWETGEAYPETEKIIILCDKFDVTMDELLRGDITQTVEKVKNEAVNEFNIENEINNEIDNEIKTKFIGHIDKFSKRIAIATTLVIIGAALLVAFAGVGNAVPKPLVIIGLIIAALIMCGAFFIFIMSGISHEDFQSKTPEMKDVMSEDEKSEFGKKFAFRMASLISALILAAIALALTYSLGESVLVGYFDRVPVAVFLCVASPIIGGIVYLGIQHQKFDIKEYNRETRHRHGHHDAPNNIYDAVCGAIMLTATGIYLLIGFVWNLWHPGWVVFPLGGIICGIISTFQKVNRKNDKDE